MTLEGLHDDYGYGGKRTQWIKTQNERNKIKEKQIEKKGKKVGENEEVPEKNKLNKNKNKRSKIKSL